VDGNDPRHTILASRTQLRALNGRGAGKMKFRSSIAALTLAVAMTACGESSDAAGIRFYPLKEFTIVSVLDGVNKGTKTTHVRDWGNRYVTIEETTLSMM
jgi:hypothetical protein